MIPALNIHLPNNTGATQNGYLKLFNKYRQDVTPTFTAVSHPLLAYKHKVFSTLTPLSNLTAAEVLHIIQDLKQGGQDRNFFKAKKPHKTSIIAFVTDIAPLNMASVFTFDPDLPKLSSPWPTIPVSDSVHRIVEPRAVLAGGETVPVSDLADFGVTRLEAEPQDGPTEYKLHLLLRPRQSFSALSTVHHASGSHPSKCAVQQGETQSELKPSRQPLGPTPNSQSRQNRLEHLTTQLLWRLQQSSPYHSSSKSPLIVPVLPQTEVNLHLQGPDKLLPGLEESQGALYEIGVSDNGSFVGLTEDELDESLSTLRAMAFSLGCKVEVLRMVLVGNCKWTENTSELNGNTAAGVDHTENLWVAEALVTPNHDHASHKITAGSSDSYTSPRSQGVANLPRIETEKGESQTEQLRVLLIGTADVGKSSLLGTLSTSTLDNGRGMIRVSSLKHPHEIVSGVTSSLTSELIGYHHITSRHGTDEISSTEVINYASGNVSTWIDIHNASEPGRLVFFTDTPGRLKYRHSTLRGLVSWAPHWAVCCVAASGEDRNDSSLGACFSTQDSHSSQSNGVDTSRANLILCLKLNLPIVIVITKLDLVSSKKILEETLRKILSIVKSSGRQPRLLVPPSDCNQDPQFRTFAKENEYKVLQKISSVREEEIVNLVPIVLTSAVRGDGIGMLHALLRHLPIPCTVEASSSPDGQSDSRRPAVLFHIDEFYTPADGHPQTGFNGSKGTRGLVLSGHLRYGTLMIGDELLVGPFTAVEDSLKKVIARTKSLPGQVGQISQGLRNLALSCDDEQWQTSADDTVTNHVRNNVSSLSAPVWQKIYVTSLRNLRLPVRKLLAGQFGTVGINSSSSDVDETKGVLSSCRVRRGMVLIKPLKKSNKDQAGVYRLFRAIFDDANSGRMIARMQVTVYIASIKAAAKILTVQVRESSGEGEQRSESRCLDDEVLQSDEKKMKNYKDQQDGVATASTKPVLINNNNNTNKNKYKKNNNNNKNDREVTFQFVSCREWVEIGTQVLVMATGKSGTGRSEGGGGGGDSAIASLEGFVGKITDAME